MKAVLPFQPRHIWREVFRYLGFLFVHYFFFWIYILIILLINMAVNNAGIASILNLSTNLYYSLFGAPLVSWALQIVYEERGWPWFRFLMFWHMMANVIAIPIIVLS